MLRTPALLFLLALNLLLPLASARGAECSDSARRSAEIGGQRISGSLLKAHRPVAKAKARLFFRGKLVWTGTTDRRGAFEIPDLSAGLYTLTIEDWGTATVLLNPHLDRTSSGQTVYYHLILMDDGCIAPLESTN